MFCPLPLSSSVLLCRWNEINNMSHNKSFFALELANKEESVQFQTVSLSKLPPVLLSTLPLGPSVMGLFYSGNSPSDGASHQSVPPSSVYVCVVLVCYV